MFKSLQAVRGFAATAVVLFHANGTFASDKYFATEMLPLFRSGDAGVPVFFVLSGVVMGLAHSRAAEARVDMGAFLWKRFRRIYLPLWPVLISVLALFAVSGAMPGLLDIVMAFLIVPGVTGGHEPLLAVEWTLRHEVLFYLLLGVAIWKPKVGRPILYGWMALSLLGGLIRLPDPWATIFSPYHLLFGLGLFVAQIYAKTPRPLLTAMAGVATIMIVAALKAYEVVDNDAASTIVSYGIGASACLAGLMALEAKGRLRTPRGLTHLGDASYSVYLVHYLAVSLFAKIGMTLGTNSYLWFGVTVIGAIGAGFAYHHAVERPLLWVSRSRSLSRAVVNPI